MSSQPRHRMLRQLHERTEDLPTKPKPENHTRINTSINTHTHTFMVHGTLLRLLVNKMCCCLLLLATATLYTPCYNKNKTGKPTTPNETRRTSFTTLCIFHISYKTYLWNYQKPFCNNRTTNLQLDTQKRVFISCNSIVSFPRTDSSQKRHPTKIA